jgi:hypothetical protein
MKHMKHASETLAATPDLFLKFPNETPANIRTKQLKHSKHAYETLTKTPKNTSYV